MGAIQRDTGWMIPEDAEKPGAPAQEQEQDLSSLLKRVLYQKERKAVIFDETISYSFASASNRRKLQPIIDTADGDVFGPKTKYEALVGKDRDTETDLLVAKKLVAATSRSFAFSRELLTVIREKCKDDNHRFVIESLV